MKILLLSRYGRLGSSSRLRFYQYIPYLQKQDIQIDTAPLFDDEYLANLYSTGKRSLAALSRMYAQRLLHVLRSMRYDLLWIEKEIFPWMPALAEFMLHSARVPYVVDYDDAIFHQYDLHSNPIVKAILQKKIDTVMQKAALVIAGNSYLAARASKAGAKWIETLPTVVDIDRYPESHHPGNEVFHIGWIGSPVTVKYLNMIKKPLEIICAEEKAELLLVGSGRIDPGNIPSRTYEWSEGKEAELIQMFDAGIMPLPDEPWERGKCGYKLIQYMACVLPIVASPVGVNKIIVDHGVNGYLASTEEDWLEAFRLLLGNKELRSKMGQNGRKEVEQQYCLQVTAPQLSEMLKKAASKLVWE